MVGDEATTQARGVLQVFNNGLANGDVNALESCFYADQAYWKDQLALTWHLRTISTPRTIAASLLETANLRNVSGGVEIDGAAVFLPATPVLVRAYMVHFFATSTDRMIRYLAIY